MIHLARAYRRMLTRMSLLATRSTGRLLIDEVGLTVECVASGPEGGDLQIGSRIVEGCVDAVVFLRDPLTAHPHEPDIQALMKVCDLHEVPLATNRASAEILLRALAGPKSQEIRSNHPSVRADGIFPWTPIPTGS